MPQSRIYLVNFFTEAWNVRVPNRVWSWKEIFKKSLKTNYVYNEKTNSLFQLSKNWRQLNSVDEDVRDIEFHTPVPTEFEWRQRLPYWNKLKIWNIVYVDTFNHEKFWIEEKKSIFGLKPLYVELD